MGLTEYKLHKRSLIQKIDSLKSKSIKNKLFDFLKSGKIAKIKSLADRVIDGCPPYDPSVQVIKDIKTWIEIRKISRELKEMEKRGEI